MRRPEKINNIVVISDPHCGCQFGLCPAKVKKDGGGWYYPSAMQKKVWRAWEEWWGELVPKFTKGEPYALVINGDILDGVHHGAKTQISQNLTIQSRIAKEALIPILDNKMCAEYYHIRGTEAHVGKSAELEESLAEELGAVVDEETGNFSRWEMWMRLDKALIHFSHHIGATSSSAYESTAVYKELVEMFNESGRWKDEPPDVVVRCLSENTEVLTKTGWKDSRSYKYPEDVLTYSPFTGKLIWQTPEDYVINESENEMIHITGRGIDILVTPDHNMVAAHHGYPWRLVRADHFLRHQGEIPLSGSYAGFYTGLTEAEMRLLGFIVADGTFVRNSRTKKPYAIRITQRQSNSEIVKKLLNDAGVKYKLHSNGSQKGKLTWDRRNSKWVRSKEDCDCYYINKEQSEIYINSLNNDKTLKRHHREMNKKLFDAYLNGLMLGDGNYNITRSYRNTQSGRFFNINKDIIDQLQELCVKHRYKSSCKTRGYYKTKKGLIRINYVLYWVSNKERQEIAQKHHNHISLIRYNGKSWCVSVPNGTLVTRYNGAVAIVGNSHRHRQFEISIATDKGMGKTLVTPGWQLKTPIVYRMASGRASTPQVGGYVIRTGDEDEVYTRYHVWKLGRSKEVVL